MNVNATEKLVLIETTQGDIKIKLYDETPLHRDNFIELIKNGIYNQRIFHRVIKDFMIQAGESNKGETSQTDLNYTIPAEFKTPEIFHKKGALAAARTADQVNPKKESSSYQFYIVTGQVYTKESLQLLEKQRFERLKQSIYRELQTLNGDTIKSLYASGDKTGLSELKNKLQEKAEAEAQNQKHTILFSEKQNEIYTTIGGTPFLDNDYTVFGEVVSGMDIVEKIQNVPTGIGDRPTTEISIISIKLIEN